MKQTLQLRLGQHLSMTPQLQQAIRLLQLSTLELHQEIQEALDSNLMLELDEEGERAGIAEGNHSSEEQTAVREVADAERELGPASESMPDELPVDTDWEAIYDSVAAPVSGSGSGGEEEEGDFLLYTSSATTLREHLHWQLDLAPFNELEFIIGEALIDGIDDDGYFKADLADIVAITREQGGNREKVERVLQRIQQEFDPTGIAARDLRECLLLQLRQLPPETPHRSAALRLLEQHFELLGRQDQVRLRKVLHCSEEELSAMSSLIRTLNPRPGTLIASKQTEYVVPDVLVFKQGGSWRVELNPESVPKIRVNAEYAGLVRRADSSEENQTLKNHLQEARWFIKSVMSRNETLLRVATKIVEFQRNFFEYGAEAMKPLVLRDIAEALEMHESTVSRVTTRKYMHTPKGTLEFKYFFSSHVTTAAGGECSATAIRALIKKLVAAEEPARPLSDHKISEVLKGQGINVARRTVAKYRESMAIAPSSERKRLA